MNDGYGSVLLIAFGGATPGCCKIYGVCPAEAHCCVDGIVGTAPSQAEHLREVASHYVVLAGFSPFNELTLKQAKAVEVALYEGDLFVLVYARFRHWTRYLHEVIFWILAIDARARESS